MSKSIVIVLTTAVLLGCLCAGCNKFNRVNYETVNIGTPQDEVKSILGRPKLKFPGRSGRWTYVHESPYYEAVIEFKDGRVSKKFWSWYHERDMDDRPDSKSDGKGETKETFKKRTISP